MSASWPQERRLFATLRIMLVAAVITAIFWGTWSLFGSVPMVSNISLPEGGQLTLPIVYSRWLDVLAIAIGVGILTYTLTSPEEDINLKEGLAIFATVDALTLIFLLLAVLISNNVVGALFFGGIPVGLILGLIPPHPHKESEEGAFREIIKNMLTGSLFGLSFGLIVGILTGIGVGLVFGLITGIGLGVGINLALGLIDLYNAPFWGHVAEWLTAADRSQIPD